MRRAAAGARSRHGVIGVGPGRRAARLLPADQGALVARRFGHAQMCNLGRLSGNGAAIIGQLLRLDIWEMAVSRVQKPRK